MTQPDSTATAELLSRIEFFRGCTPREIADIASLVIERRFDAGDTLCRQGDAEQDAFALIDGEASVVVDGEEVGRARPGDVIGELSMLSTGRRTATVTAVTSVGVLVIDPREIDSVLAADPSSSQRLGRRPRDT
jgi:CRP/FNR family cyclic AMP-dependent transcriptional regulator